MRYRWLKLRDASADLAIYLCQCTLKIPRVEFYARIEPSVSVQQRDVCSKSSNSMHTGRFMYFRPMNPVYYRPSLLLGVQLKCHCKTQRSTPFSSTVSVLLVVVFVILTYLYM